ncbi:MAG: hypothetical protein JKY37_24315, partial [Nannocystaceae bacterium]|nr:hypothetical protein [Nannocystaceae bacterium]
QFGGVLYPLGCVQLKLRGALEGGRSFVVGESAALVGHGLEMYRKDGLSAALGAFGDDVAGGRLPGGRMPLASLQNTAARVRV